MFELVASGEWEFMFFIAAIFSHCVATIAVTFARHYSDCKARATRWFSEVPWNCVEFYYQHLMNSQTNTKKNRKRMMTEELCCVSLETQMLFLKNLPLVETCVHSLVSKQLAWSGAWNNMNLELIAMDHKLTLLYIKFIKCGKRMKYFQITVPHRA